MIGCRTNAHLPLAVVVISGLLMLATEAAATDYRGAGDTGWGEPDRRVCCEDAVALAQGDSAGQCRRAGGAPQLTTGATRGLCDWQIGGAGDDINYRCTATSYVFCNGAQL